MFLPSNITLQFGDSGDFVTELQRRLAVVKCFSEDMVNGFFDGNTVGGVTQFQVMVGLHADGVAGPETLRRLNGVIAGSGTANADDEKKEEEKSLHASQQHAMHVLYGPPPPENPATWETGSPPAETQSQQPSVAIGAQSMPMQPAAPQMQAPQEINREAERVQAQHQLQQDRAMATAFITDTATQRVEPSDIAGREKLPSDQTDQTRELAREQPRGFLGRITQFANTAIQRLADYFEKKLPPDTLKEVRAIGLAMAATGMKETAVPQGPDLPSPAPTPTRGPEQIQRV